MSLRFGPWLGAVTSSSAVIKAGVGSSDAVRLVLADDAALGANRRVMAPNGLSMSEMLVATFHISGLAPSAHCYYALEVNGAASPVGRFETFPHENAPASFRFVCSGDARNGSNHEVFDTIREEEPLFFAHLGDLHYENIDAALSQPHYRADYRAALEEVFSSGRQAELYRNVPIAYVWDDHDFSDNNANASAPSRTAARLSYQECVPHYPLALGAGNVPIAQAFTVGRVRFLITDARSEKVPKGEHEDVRATVLGPAQKDWFKAELLASKFRNPLVVWINSFPWIEEPTDGSDRWGGFTAERAELATFIKANGIKNLCMLSADGHFVAMDDGTNSDYAAGGGGGFPLFQAASLDAQSLKRKGGPYAFEMCRGRGQYGVFEVEDTGGPTVTVRWEGRDDTRAVLRSESEYDPQRRELKLEFRSPRG